MRRSVFGVDAEACCQTAKASCLRAQRGGKERKATTTTTTHGARDSAAYPCGKYCECGTPLHPRDPNNGGKNAAEIERSRSQQRGETLCRAAAKTYIHIEISASIPAKTTCRQTKQRNRREMRKRNAANILKSGEPAVYTGQGMPRSGNAWA